MLITGCDNKSGFGFKTASALICRGFRVLACCYDANAATKVSHALKAIARAHEIKEDHVRTLVVDVRSDESVTACVAAAQKYASSSGSTLWSLVNNAGVQSGALVDWTSLDDYKVQPLNQGWVMLRKLTPETPNLTEQRAHRFAWASIFSVS